MTSVRASALGRWRAHPALLDTALAALLAVTGLVFLFHRTEIEGRRPDGWAVVLVVLTTAPLIARRRYPAGALVVSAAALTVSIAADYHPTPAVIAPLVLMYHAGDRPDRARGLAVAAAVAVAVPVVGALAGPQDLVTTHTLGWMALLALPAAAGEAVRSRRAFVAELRRRAEEAERAREEEADRRVQEERLRIARDLHDVLAHTISTVNVQAGVAAHLVERDPAHAREALRAIRESTADAMSELRSVVGVLRGGADGEAPTRPAPGLAALPELVEQSRLAGLPVTADLADVAPPPPEAVQLAAYRIVQEALTNVVRHAGMVPTGVRVVVADRELHVRVHNGPADGSHAALPPAPPGTGIVGMRERASSLGGRLDAGPSEDGGFTVAAWLPVRGRA